MRVAPATTLPVRKGTGPVSSHLACAAMGVVVTLLGPFRVVCDGTDVTPSSTKAQALLATLAVQPGATVLADTLVDDLWSDLPPDRGRRVLQVRIAEIRKQLADGRRLAEAGRRVRRRRLPAGDAAGRAGQRPVRPGVEDAIAAVQRGELAAASTMLREALGMWRGEALAGIRCSRALESAAAELEQRRLAAIEERFAAELAEGCHQRLVAELEPLVAAHPLRERLWEQLVLALYRSDRQTEASGRARSCVGSCGTRSGSLPGPDSAASRPQSWLTTRCSTRRRSPPPPSTRADARLRAAGPVRPHRRRRRPRGPDHG